MLLLFTALAGAVVVLLWTKVTRWYELVILGGFGFLLGGVCAGARTFDNMSLASVWSAVFG
ncbi:hypothetical protein ACIBCT_21400 [Streptosporangium sp. NPDC050855]|uniref:hypothetical protein n=1 Tax=Streptosporangium sp. NPDC050855 TaxID=3366194 RepID=UPI0037BD5E8A